MSVHMQQDFITCRKHAGTSEWLSLETERALLIMFFQHSLDLKKKKTQAFVFHVLFRTAASFSARTDLLFDGAHKY